jgi:hypothetical protein
MFRSRECVLVNNLCVTNPAANPHNRAFIDGAKPGQGNVWRNNLSFNGSPGDPAVNPEDALSFISPTEGNLLGIDPFFVDPKAADFRLLPGSPAIGKGRTSDGMSTVDLAGAARGSVADIGAYTSRGAVRIPR